MPVPTLLSQRLILRPFTLADAKRVQQLAGDYEIADTTGHMPHPYLDGMAEEWISTQEQDFADGSGATFGITLRKTGELMGAIGLSIHGHDRRAELGYWIGVAYWNRGYMSEAARRVIAYAFEDLKLNRVYASHFARNPASGHVMQNAGMTYEGTWRQHFVRWTEPEDLVYYGILKDEWKAETITR
ncbi:MAG: GNAT family N-acetyltransferase [Anaerolineae bacterium]|nr:GNAT family N-acetyltransferase [Anaerolineae bacterium]